MVFYFVIIVQYGRERVISMLVVYIHPSVAYQGFELHYLYQYVTGLADAISSLLKLEDPR